MTEREWLVEELNLIFGNIMNTQKADYGLHECELAIADYMLADRKRICGPLEEVIASDWGDTFNAVRVLSKAVEDTLKLAGLGDEE